MPVVPNDYQVSSSHRKLEIIIMKFLLSFMFVAVTVALVIKEEVSSQHEIAKELLHIFNMSLADGVECVQKSGVTSEDIIYMQERIVARDSEITDMQSLRRAGCAMICGAQKEGTLIGREVNLETVYEQYDKSELPADVIDKLSECIRACKEQVSAQNEEDECMIMYKLRKCMYERTTHVMNKH